MDQVEPLREAETMLFTKGRKKENIDFDVIRTKILFFVIVKKIGSRTELRTRE